MRVRLDVGKFAQRLRIEAKVAGYEQQRALRSKEEEEKKGTESSTTRPAAGLRVNCHLIPTSAQPGGLGVPLSALRWPTLDLEIEQGREREKRWLVAAVVFFFRLAPLFETLTARKWHISHQRK